MPLNTTPEFCSSNKATAKLKSLPVSLKALYLTTRELEQTNKEINKKQISKEELKKINILYKDIENTFQGFFGTKVKMAPGKKRGKIIIEYASNDDLERILNIIK